MIFPSLATVVSFRCLGSRYLFSAFVMHRLYCSRAGQPIQVLPSVTGCMIVLSFNKQVIRQMWWPFLTLFFVWIWSLSGGNVHMKTRGEVIKQIIYTAVNSSTVDSLRALVGHLITMKSHEWSIRNFIEILRRKNQYRICRCLNQPTYT